MHNLQFSNVEEQFFVFFSQFAIDSQNEYFTITEDEIASHIQARVSVNTASALSAPILA